MWCWSTKASRSTSVYYYYSEKVRNEWADIPAERPSAGPAPATLQAAPAAHCSRPDGIDLTHRASPPPRLSGPRGQRRAGMRRRGDFGRGRPREEESEQDDEDRPGTALEMAKLRAPWLSISSLNSSMTSAAKGQIRGISSSGDSSCTGSAGCGWRQWRRPAATPPPPPDTGIPDSAHPYRADWQNLLQIGQEKHASHQEGSRGRRGSCCRPESSSVASSRGKLASVARPAVHQLQPIPSRQPLEPQTTAIIVAGEAASTAHTAHPLHHSRQLRGHRGLQIGSWRLPHRLPAHRFVGIGPSRNHQLGEVGQIQLGILWRRRWHLSLDRRGRRTGQSATALRPGHTPLCCLWCGAINLHFVRSQARLLFV